MANIDKELNQIKNAVYGREVRGSIHDGIDKINKETEIATGKADEAHDVMESIINDGFDNAALESNFEQKLDDKINNLQPEWTQFKEQTNQQLADKAKKISGLAFSQVKGTGGSISKLSRVKPTLVCIDDDTRKELYTKFYPYLQQKGIVISAAVITSRVDVDPAHITTEQLKVMNESGLVKFCNHTHEHVHLANLTEEEVHYQIREAQRFLEDNGIFTKHLVYPFGSLNEMVKQVAALYVDSATQSNDTYNQVNDQLLDTYKMGRIVLERPLQEHKDMIDNIVEDNGLMIINTHSQYPEFTVEKVDEIIDYALSKDVDITDITTAFNRFRNVIEFDDRRGVTSGISANNFERGIFHKEEPLKVFTTNLLKQSDPITAYEDKKITTTNFTSTLANTNGWELGAGVLFTDRRARDEYSYQMYHPFSHSSIYKRNWDVARNEWTRFEKVGGGSPVIHEANETTINARGRQNYTVLDDSFRASDVLVVNPSVKLATGIIVGGLVTEDGKISIEVTNITDSSITIPKTSYRIKTV